MDDSNWDESLSGNFNDGTEVQIYCDVAVSKDSN